MFQIKNYLRDEMNTRIINIREYYSLRNAAVQSGFKIINKWLMYVLSTASVALWSEFLATDPEARVRFPALPEKKVALE
jgi:hypothetical protein